MADEGETYVVVQKQMQDLVEIQTLAIRKLQEDISSHESTLKESFLSKENYEAEVQELQRSIREDFVPCEKYKETLYELETEKLEHLKTQGKLNEVTDRLEFALGEIEILTKQLEREKAAFEKASLRHILKIKELFGQLKQKTVIESSKSAQLTSKCTEINRKVEEQENELGSKNEEIKALEQKLKQQEVSYRKKLTEAEIQRKQEQYIAKLLENQDRLKNSSSETAMSKTAVKTSKR